MCSIHAFYRTEFCMAELFSYKFSAKKKNDFHFSAHHFLTFKSRRTIAAPQLKTFEQTRMYG